MGMLKSYLNVVLQFHKQRRFSGSVCVLGNQEIWSDYDGLKECFTQMGVPYRAPKEVRGHSSRMFLENPVLKQLARRFVHASVFFDMMGMDEYVDVDVFADDNPVLQLDLNKEVGADLHGRFDLVIDGGTTEHIFDVRTVLANLTAMTKVGGHVMHISTFQADHGFYAFSPALYYEYYLANGFADPECILLYVDYQNILETWDRPHEYVRYEYGKTVLPQAADKPFLVFFVARKAQNVERTTIPIQGLFAARAARGEAVETPMPPPAQPLFERVVPEFARGPLAFLRPLARACRNLVARLRRPPAPPSLPRI